jgi:hypothetical protein
MRTFLVPALAAALSLPTLSLAASPATSFDDATYSAQDRGSFVLVQAERAPSAFDDAGLGVPDAPPARAASPARFTEHNPFDDAGLRGPELAPEREAAAVRVATSASQAMADCACCQS